MKKKKEVEMFFEKVEKSFSKTDHRYNKDDNNYLSGVRDAISYVLENWELEEYHEFMLDKIKEYKDKEYKIEG